MSDKFKVLEFAGTPAEVEVFGPKSYSECKDWVDSQYYPGEADEIGVDIVRENGSTEY